MSKLLEGLSSAKKLDIKIVLEDNLTSKLDDFRATGQKICKFEIKNSDW